MGEKLNGSLIVCLDLRDLNKAVKRKEDCVPAVDSVTTKLHGSTPFSRFNKKSAYWNFDMDQGSL